MSYRLCHYLKHNGLPCRSAALRGQSLCYFHHRRQQQRLDFAQDRRRAEVCDWRLPPLNSLDEVQHALHRIMNELSRGRLDPGRAGPMLYAAQQAAVPLRSGPKNHKAAP